MSVRFWRATGTGLSVLVDPKVARPHHKIDLSSTRGQWHTLPSVIHGSVPTLLAPPALETR